MEAERKIFSVTLGSTSTSSMKKKLEAFKASLKQDAELLFPLPVLLCAFDVEGKKRVDVGSADLPSKIHFGNGWGSFLELNINFNDDNTVEGQGNGIPTPITEFFKDQDMIFLGNDCVTYSRLRPSSVF